MADRVSLVGWIVDLRGNTGGNMWPMVAGVGPVLGNGVAGFFVPPVGASTPWSFPEGSRWSPLRPPLCLHSPKSFLPRSPQLSLLPYRL